VRKTAAELRAVGVAADGGDVLVMLRLCLDVQEVEGDAVVPFPSSVRCGVVGNVVSVKLLGRWPWCSGAGRCREGTGGEVAAGGSS
jgi:hypothetical protein